MSFAKRKFIPAPSVRGDVGFIHSEKACAHLVRSGHEAYVVGGWVRDALIGRIPHDCDVCTSATPDEVRELFSGSGVPVVPTGEKYGTVSVVFDKHSPTEITTFRIDGKYEDGRHPNEVAFTPSLEEDLKRRDFTINAMAYDPGNDEIIALDESSFNDAELKIIRCVGDPDDRFAEDALRMLRAIRFCATLGFQLEAGTMASIARNAHLIKKVSAERVREELTKILCSERPETLLLAQSLGITKYILPEFDALEGCTQNNKWHRMSLIDHTFAVVRGVDRNNKALRWAAFLHDFGKPKCWTKDEAGHDHFYGHPGVSAKLAEYILSRLKFDNDTLNKVVHLCAKHDRMSFITSAGEKAYRRAIADIGVDFFVEWAELANADIMAHSSLAFRDLLPTLSRMKEIYSSSVSDDRSAFKVKDLAIDGNVVCEVLGIEPGPEVGKALAFLLKAVIDDPSKNTQEELVKLLSTMIDKTATTVGGE